MCIGTEMEKAIFGVALLAISMAIDAGDGAQLVSEVQTAIDSNINMPQLVRELAFLRGDTVAEILAYFEEADAATIQAQAVRTEFPKSDYATV